MPAQVGVQASRSGPEYVLRAILMPITDGKVAGRIDRAEWSPSDYLVGRHTDLLDLDGVASLHPDRQLAGIAHAPGGTHEDHLSTALL